ncbi:MAG: M24 family metallopeptidase [Gemmatimonadota bacterium]|nr:M24 family metallopeptidase [Gemmatimonadota bacterium]
MRVRVPPPASAERPLLSSSSDASSGYYFGDGRYRPGAVFTIEPGIHIAGVGGRAPRHAPEPPLHGRHNTGVRIEDDYVITPTGLRRISSAPREIDEIETLMKKRLAS